MADQYESFELRLIEPGDNFTGFSVGESKFIPLKVFLTRHAKSYQVKSLARTYALFNSASKVIAYITLVCGEVVIERGDTPPVIDQEVDYKYLSYPSVKIARLAVDSRFRENGMRIGEKLVQLALGIAKEIVSTHVGCRFVFVDSKQSAVKFYEKIGFTTLDTEENRGREEPVMFIDLMKVDTQ